MRILFIADGRSPTALNWMQYFVDQGEDVHLVSMYTCEPALQLASLNILTANALAGVPNDLTPSRPPIAGTGTPKNDRELRSLFPVQLRTWLRQRLVPFGLPGMAARLREIITRLQPDLIHAMRIPYEGMLAALAEPEVPLLVSVWGNDFTLHARSTKRMAQLTRLTLQKATALHTDCQRDQRLAQSWGFPLNRPTIVLPGAGGIQLKVFHPPYPTGKEATQNPVIINPRGLRTYVRNDTFFKSIPLVLEKIPAARFICPAMQGEAPPERWRRDLGISQAVELLPRLERTRMAALFRQAQIVVSITEHDGTPNTLLEAMACGCFPIAGDLESIREWITPGENGLLVAPDDPQALAEAVISTLNRPDLIQKARELNSQLVMERADFDKVMPQARSFYELLLRR